MPASATAKLREEYQRLLESGEIDENHRYAYTKPEDMYESHRAICRRVAHGQRTNQIAKDLGVSRETIRSIVNGPVGQQVVREIQDELDLTTPEILMRSAPEVLKKLEDIKDPACEAIMKVLDPSWGSNAADLNEIKRDMFRAEMARKMLSHGDPATAEVSKKASPDVEVNVNTDNRSIADSEAMESLKTNYKAVKAMKSAQTDVEPPSSEETDVA